MFRVGLLLIRSFYSVYTAIGICNACMLNGCWQDRNGSQHKPMTYTNCCIYGVPPDDEQ